MPQRGDTAPDFALAGIREDTKQQYRLSEATEAGKFVLLVFYPADFSPVCTAEMCALRDSEFFEFTEDVVVWGVSGDSLYAHKAFADNYDLPFPLLADTDHSVALKYSSRYDEWEGQPEITKRAVFLVGPDREVKYAWRSDDAYVEPDLKPIKEALDTAIEEGLDVDSDQPDLAMDDERRRVEKLD